GRRVSQSGGAPVRLTNVDRAHQDAAFHAYPSFLPDGRHFIFLRAGGPDGSGVYLGSLDAKPEDQTARRLVATGVGPVYVPSADPAHGHLLFVREDTLMAQAFDAKRLELDEDPVPITEKVLNTRTGGYFSASSTGVLAYRSGGVANARLSWF